MLYTIRQASMLHVLRHVLCAATCVLSCVLSPTSIATQLGLRTLYISSTATFEILLN